MTCVVEIADERLNGGYPWLVGFSNGRQEVGVGATYEAAVHEVAGALHRERQAREIGADYRAGSHAD